MSLQKFLTSKVFFKQLAIALGIIIVLVFVMMKWLSFTTNHGEEITVPDLSKLSVAAAEEKLDDMDLEYVLLDTTEYQKDYPKFSVVKQDPIAGSKVKSGRKIYIKINSDAYRDIIMPDLIEQSLRQVEPTLKALGLEMGEKTYKPYLGKDMVLEMRYKGKKIKAGDKIPKASKIDLVLGDGKVGFEEEVDSIPTTIDDEEF
ncbi:PASTA domain-containing protein [Flavobacterium sp.]|uniref:PASTA domain-containing protein n=1 Tax=Flavobacterium sp. TaxID=239 RepID=UPI002625D9BB|nr:PASTA domain-containing protein [Flavobacterium sp.]MDD3005075.1 PASTA domain-containing protein [Flavobacterium sp.]